jgi:hypothetical protein
VTVQIRRQYANEINTDGTAVTHALVAITVSSQALAQTAAPVAPKVETAAEKAARERAEAEKKTATEKIETIVVTATSRA